MIIFAGTAAAALIARPGSNAPAPAIHPARAACAALTSGLFTYYSPGLGVCGQVNTTSKLVVALSYIDFDPYTTNGTSSNPLCGKKLRAFYNGNSVDVTVVDRCPACAEGGLNLSPAAFRKFIISDRQSELTCWGRVEILAPLSLGVVDGTWEWI
jgi:hypothetical protein